MRAAEEPADDVRLTLASAEEATGLGGEFGLVTGPVLPGQAVLEVGVDQLVRVQLGRVRGQEVQLGVVGVGGEPVADLLGAVGGVPVDHEMDLAVEVAGEPVQEAAQRLGGGALGEDHEVSIFSVATDRVMSVVVGSGQNGRGSTAVEGGI